MLIAFTGTCTNPLGFRPFSMQFIPSHLDKHMLRAAGSQLNEYGVSRNRTSTTPRRRRISRHAQGHAASTTHAQGHAIKIHVARYTPVKGHTQWHVTVIADADGQAHCSNVVIRAIPIIRRGWNISVSGWTVNRFTGMMVRAPGNFDTASQIFLNDVFLCLKMAHFLKKNFMLGF